MSHLGAGCGYFKMEQEYTFDARDYVVEADKNASEEYVSLDLGRKAHAPKAC